MMAVVDPVLNPTLCDTVTLELREALSPYNLVYSVKDTIDIHGMGLFRFPDAILNEFYYLVLKHRTSLVVWSKTPLFFNTTEMSFDFTAP